MGAAESQGAMGFEVRLRWGKGVQDRGDTESRSMSVCGDTGLEGGEFRMGVAQSQGTRGFAVGLGWREGVQDRGSTESGSESVYGGLWIEGADSRQGWHRVKERGDCGWARMGDGVYDGGGRESRKEEVCSGNWMGEENQDGVAQSQVARGARMAGGET